MKKILIALFGAIIVASMPTAVSALDVSCGDPNSAECLQKSDETQTNDNDASKTEGKEIPSTFATDIDDNERSVKFRMGSNLLLTGNNLNSDLDNKSGLTFVAGNNLSLKTTADYGFIAGNMINFSGETVRDLYIAGNIVKVAKDAKIGRDVFVAASNVTVDTDIPGNLAATAGTVILKDVKISGNLNLDAGKIEFDGKVEIAGQLSYNDDATVTGLDGVTYGSIDAYHIEQPDPAAVFSMRVYGKIMSIVALFLAIAIICAFYPGLHDQLEHESSLGRFGMDLAIGLGMLIGAPAIALVLICTIVAAPLGIVIIALYLVLLYLAQAFAGAWLGHIIIEKLCRARGNVFVESLVGLILIGAASLVPYLGILTNFFAMVLGLGIIATCLKPRKKAVKNQKK